MQIDNRQKSADLEQSACYDTVGEHAVEVDQLIRGLACVVVDELIRLKNNGMSPADIEAAYEHDATETREEAGI